MTALKFDWKMAVEAIGVVAIVGSLLMVAWELRQNTQATMGETAQSLLELLSSYDEWVLDSSFAATVKKIESDEGSASAVESYQYTTWLAGKFNICEHVFDRREEGLVNEDYWIAWEAGCAQLLIPRAARNVWREGRQAYGPRFRRHFDAKVAEYD